MAFYDNIGSNQNDIRNKVIIALQRSGLGLTEDSSWDEIIAGLKILYPDIYELYMNGTNKEQNPVIVLRASCGSSSGTFNHTFEKDHILVNAYFGSTSGMVGAIVTTTNPIDLTNYNKLVIKIDAGSGVYAGGFGVDAKQNHSDRTPDHSTSITSGINTYTYDISSFTGEYYPQLIVCKNSDKSSFKVYEFYLE